MPTAIQKFLQGMAAAIHLRNRAVERRSALECIVLQGNLIDGCLRIGLVLKAQLDSRTNAIDDSLLRQEDSDAKLTERELYTRCLKADVIERALFEDLSAAYYKRNNCIHSYLRRGLDYD